MRLWKKQAPRKVYVGRHEDKLSRLSALHVDPDDDQRTREDSAQEKAAGRPSAGSTGGPNATLF
jgi:hypothetical protein